MGKRTVALCEHILKETRGIKSEIMLELADVIPLQGGVPQDAAKELEGLANLDGTVIGVLALEGFSVFEVADKPGYLAVEVGGTMYMTHNSKIMGSDKSAPVDKPEPPVSKEEESKAPEVPKEETTEVEEEIPETEEIPEEDVVEEPVSEPEETQEKPEEEPESEPEPLKATIIGGDFNLEPVVTPMSRADMFVEEKRKAAGEFVFDTYRINVCHVGSKAEDMQFMIAPLKINKFATPTVPIIVSIYYRGKLYTASSFDKNEDGRNIVSIDVNEYYFLCRGSFNDKGEFQSSVVTTGPSASQGDIITPVSHKRHIPTGASVKNGHLKYRYQGEEGPGIIEVFPLELGEKDFVIMTRCGDFVEYIPLASGGHGLNRALTYHNGIRSEIVCMWDGDYLESDVMPV